MKPIVRRAPPPATRWKRVLVLSLVAALALTAFLVASVFDVLRLGPSTYVLPPDALRVSVSVGLLPDRDEQFDYYSVLVLVWNGVNDSSIRPYWVEVTVEFDGLTMGGWIPQAGDIDREVFEQAPPFGINLAPPTGVVQTHSGDPGMFRWEVRGERGLRREPVFETEVDFLLQVVRVSQGIPAEATVTTSVVWYYTNAIQAYPVASATLASAPSSSWIFD